MIKLTAKLRDKAEEYGRAYDNGYQTGYKAGRRFSSSQTRQEVIEEIKKGLLETFVKESDCYYQVNKLLEKLSNK